MDEQQRSPEDTSRSNAAALLGAKGGATTHKKYGATHYAEIGRKGAKKRWDPEKPALNSDATQSQDPLEAQESTYPEPDSEAQILEQSELSQELDPAF